MLELKDWADEIAHLMGCASCGDAETMGVATALRKAKADGMREAAKYAELKDSNDDAVLTALEFLAQDLFVAADKLEKGE